MKKKDLFKKTETVISETQEALQTMYDSLNQGQKKKIVKEEKVKKLFDRHGVNYD